MNRFDNPMEPGGDYTKGGVEMVENASSERVQKVCCRPASVVMVTHFLLFFFKCIYPFSKILGVGNTQGSIHESKLSIYFSSSFSSSCEKLSNVTNGAQRRPVFALVEKVKRWHWLL